MFRKLFFLLPYSMRRFLYFSIRKSQFANLQRMREVVTSNGYSYLPFDRSKSIFVHIPKGAGVSICQSLYGNLAGGHASVSEYQIIFSKIEYENYFKFTFVRNPWDRVFSAYNFLKKGGMTEEDRRWAELELNDFDTFHDFVILGLRRRSIREWIHFLPQTDLLFLPGRDRLEVDFLGYFENIQNDFQCIARKLGVDGPIILASKNETSVGNKLNFQEYYTDQTKAIVAEVYRRDIKCFGYNFDNTSLPHQLAARGQLIY